MRFAKTLATAAVAALVGLAVPGDVHADHRHGRGCGHGAYAYGYRAPAYPYGYARAQGPYPRVVYVPYAAYPPGSPYAWSYGPGYGYGYRYGYAAPYRSYRPGVSVVHFHGRARCSRSHVSVRLGW